MQKLRLERKVRKKPMWPWLLLLLITLAVLFWLTSAASPSVTS